MKFKFDDKTKFYIGLILIAAILIVIYPYTSSTGDFIVYSCDDTDGGKAYYTPGMIEACSEPTCILSNTLGYIRSYDLAEYNSKTGITTLSEMYCSGNNYFIAKYKCPGNPIKFNKKGACQNCTGNIKLLLNDIFNEAVVQPGATVSATVSGFVCNGAMFYIKKDSCTGTKVCNGLLNGEGKGSCSFKAPTVVKTNYKYYACTDKNGDGKFTSTGESSVLVYLTVKK
ncbi:MAG: hypothetical protein PHU12_02525 [Candidatus Aenigmarchaeota archaeon]|nr:hypothetical protein [Candidatus Aenigmarchaeota archaeon]